MGRVNWKQIVDITKNQILPFFHSQGVKPTLRTIFYWLVSRNLIPNTRTAYTRLSIALSNARKNGIIDWDALEDKTREVIRPYYESKPPENAEEIYQQWLEEFFEKLKDPEKLEEFIEEILPPPPSVSVSKWTDQPKLPMIFLEKEALAETIKNWTWDWEIPIFVLRGYPSWTYLYKIAKEMHQYAGEGRELIILYLGDCDPSGVDIERFLKEGLNYFEVKYEIVRVAVTPEQVKKYNLPPAPDSAETLQKLKRDPRSQKYFGVNIAAMSDQEFYEFMLNQGKVVVELDSLVAIVPDEFKKLLDETIASYFDEEIYNKILKKSQEIKGNLSEIKEEAKNKAKELLKKIFSS